MKSVLIVIIYSSLLMFAADKNAEAPDAIFYNGSVYWNNVGGFEMQSSRIHTGLGWSYGGDRPQAFAVRNGRITQVGMSSELRKLAGPKTQLVDLHGAFVMPGFNDAHIHLWSGGLEMQHVELVTAKSLEDMKARIAAKAKETPSRAWMQGRGWDHTKWKDQTLPTRQDIDPVTGDHPAFFPRIDGHIGVANSAALKFAGIDRNTPDPPGGKIDRDANGDPTGILRETAKEALQAKIPEVTIEQRRKAVELALAEAARWGLTSIQEPPVNPQDPTEWKYFLVYEELENQGKLTARVTE